MAAMLQVFWQTQLFYEESGAVVVWHVPTYGPPFLTQAPSPFTFRLFHLHPHSPGFLDPPSAFVINSNAISLSDPPILLITRIPYAFNSLLKLLGSPSLSPLLLLRRWQLPAKFVGPFLVLPPHSAFLILCQHSCQFPQALQLCGDF